MKSKILGLLAMGLLAAPMAARAAMITELFQVTLPYASGVYAAGHVFEITVTYDDAGTVMHQWNDGVNGIAEFGLGDDSLAHTWSLVDNPSYTLFADAQISISGRAAVSAPIYPLPLYSYNRSWFYVQGDPSALGFTDIELRADDVSMKVTLGGKERLGYALFTLLEWRTGSDPLAVAQAEGFGFVTRRAVPEPGTLALLGLGLLGLGLTRQGASKSVDAA